MKSIAERRLANQRLIGPGYRSIADAVSALLAVQSQDYPAAKWALAQRIPGATDAAFDAALASGAILRTHVMRPTWHFVLPKDIRWLQELTRHRVHALSVPYHKRMELTARHLLKMHDVIARALEGGKATTRPELAKLFAAAGLEHDNFRMGFVLMHAELECLVVSGPLKGKQQTYALLDERVPPQPAKDRDEALAELAVRYFSVHGPAKVHDLAWWSGLTVGDVRKAIAAAGDAIVAEEIGGETYWAGTTPRRVTGLRERPVHLLPNYDEYFIAYKDRTAVYDPERVKGHIPVEFFYRHVLGVDGAVLGQWSREIGKGKVIVTVTPLVPLTPSQEAGLAAEVERHGAFLHLPAELVLTPPFVPADAPAAGNGRGTLRAEGG